MHSETFLVILASVMMAWRDHYCGGQSTNKQCNRTFNGICESPPVEVKYPIKNPQHSSFINSIEWVLIGVLFTTIK